MFADVAIFGLCEKMRILDTWDESTGRRLLHHFNGYNYHPGKKSLVFRLPTVLDEQSTAMLRNMTFERERNGFNTSRVITSLFGGNYSPRTTLYLNDFSRVQIKQLYASQTKILENETAGRACLFGGLCEGSSPKSSTHTLAKYLAKTRPFCCFVFQNLRLGSIN